MTGQASPAYSSPVGNPLTRPVIHPDGTIFTIDGDTVVGLDPQSGQPKFQIPMNDTTVDYTNTYQVFCFSSPLPPGGSTSGSTTYSAPAIGNLIIAGDGYAYVPYLYTKTVARFQASCEGQTNTEEHLVLLRIGSDGGSSSISLGDWYSTYSTNWNSFPCCDWFSLESQPVPSVVFTDPLTNADQGAIVNWHEATAAYCASSHYDESTNSVIRDGCVDGVESFNVATTSGTSVATHSRTTTIPFQSTPLQPVLQLADGTYVGTVGAAIDSLLQSYMVRFDSSGNPLGVTAGYVPQMATADGGVISGDGTMFDASLNITGQMTLPTYSWYGFTYSDPVSRVVPSANMLQVDLSRTSGGSVSSNGANLNLPDDPYSLRLVPTSDDGKQGQALREITYTLTRLDGRSTPRGDWYVTEHQTNFSVTPSGDGMSGGLEDEDDKRFPDTVGCQNPFFGCSPTNTTQTFTISTRTGTCRPPSYGDPQTTHCTTHGGTIIVHSPKGHDYGKLGIYFDSTHVLINGFYNWSQD